MKAIAQDRYGPPDVLLLTETDPPEPGADDILVRVHAASVNAYDWHVMRGDPYLARLLSPGMFGLSGPKVRIRGRDFAGRVEAVGANVTRFRTGDEVFGDTGRADGTFAEYTCVPAASAAPKPAALSFEQAAAVPLAASTALRGLRDAGRVREGHRVLVNGASGGVGTFAIQLAKSLGADVTAVCSTRNAELAVSLGADHVVDYTREDFAHGGTRYDVVFDLVANRSLADLRRALTPEGTLVLSGGGVSTGGSLVGPLGLVVKAGLVGPFIDQRVVLLNERLSGDILPALGELIDAATVAPVIDRTYPLAQVPEAIRYVENEHARAKVAITV